MGKKEVKNREKLTKNYRSREYLEKYERIESSIQRRSYRKYYGGQNWLGRGILAHHPEDPSLEFREFTDYHQFFSFLLGTEEREMY